MYVWIAITENGCYSDYGATILGAFDSCDLGKRACEDHLDGLNMAAHSNDPQLILGNWMHPKNYRELEYDEDGGSYSVVASRVFEDREPLELYVAQAQPYSMFSSPKYTVARYRVQDYG